MQNLSKIQIAAALVATLGFATHGTANANPTNTGSDIGVSEKQAPSQISKSIKLAEKKEKKEKKAAKGKEGSCKGKEGAKEGAKEGGAAK